MLLIVRFNNKKRKDSPNQNAFRLERNRRVRSIYVASQSHIKDCNRDMDDLRQSRDDLVVSSRESEKKAKNLEADLMQAQEDLAASERQRRAAEAERDDLQEELSGGLKDK